MLNIDDIKNPKTAATPADTAATLQPGFASSVVNTTISPPAAPPVPQAPQAPDSSASSDMSDKLSTWLQNYSPDKGSAPLVIGQQSPSEQVGLSTSDGRGRTDASQWKPGTDLYDWMKAVYGDPEEDARRERANKTRLGIMAVGDAIRHMGNIYHTTKGAPAQTLTNATKDESDRQIKETILLQQQRQKAADMLLKHQKMEADRLYRQQEADRKNYETMMRAKDYADRADYRKKQAEAIDARNKDMEERRKLSERQFEQKKKMDEQNFKLRQGTQAENAYHHRVMEGISARRAAQAAQRGGGRVGSSGKTDQYITGGGTVIEIPKGRMNNTNVSRLHRMLIDKADPKERMQLRQSKNAADKMVDILNHTDDKDISKALIELGAIGIGNVSDMENSGSSWWQEFMDELNQDMDSFEDQYPETRFLQDDDFM